MNDTVKGDPLGPRVTDVKTTDNNELIITFIGDCKIKKKSS